MRRLVFIRGASFPDPGRVFHGSGKQTRFVRLSSADILEKPEVQALLTLGRSSQDTDARERQRADLSSGRFQLSSAHGARPRKKPNQAMHEFGSRAKRAGLKTIWWIVGIALIIAFVLYFSASH